MMMMMMMMMMIRRLRKKIEMLMLRMKGLVNQKRSVTG